MSAVVRTFILPFWCFSDFSLSSYGQTCIRLTFIYYLDLWPLTSPRMSVMRVLVFHPVGAPLREMWRIFRLGINWPITWPLTFRPLNRVMGHPCHGFLSCQFSAFSALLFSTKCQAPDRQKDGKTDDGHQRFMPPPPYTGREHVSVMFHVMHLSFFMPRP